MTDVNNDSDEVVEGREYLSLMMPFTARPKVKQAVRKGK